MSVPKPCVIYHRGEQAAKRHEYFREPFARDVLKDGGFIIYDQGFRRIIGSNPTLEVIAEEEAPFAHEAGVYIPATGDVFITSNQIREGGQKSVRISRVSRDKTGSSNRCTVERIATDMALANGGVNCGSGVLFCEQGSLTAPGGLTYMQAGPPYETTRVLTGFHGRWFNSVNDVVMHRDGSVWFTDPPYGYEQGIRPVPQLPPQTYRFDPLTNDVRAVEDSLKKPNGLCFSPDQQVLYVTDTDGVRGDIHCGGVYDPTRAASIYAFDVITRNGGQFLVNKRLFAFADSGIPDGIKCDREGNVYSGCGDGVHVWTPGGMLMGKICTPGGCANFCFGKEGEMFLLNEQKLWRAQLSPHVRGDLLGI